MPRSQLISTEFHDVIASNIRMPQPLKYIHLRRTIWVDLIMPHGQLISSEFHDAIAGYTRMPQP
jgi:hypothetical protein